MSEYNHEDLTGVVDHLEEISFYMKMNDESKWSIQAYSGAAESLQEADPSVLEDPEQIDGIGDSVAEVISQFLQDGESDKLDYLSEKFPDIRELTIVEGIGVKTAKRIYDTLGIETLDKLQEAGERGLLTDVPRVGPKTQENILEEIEEVHAGAQDRKPIEKVDSYYEGISARLKRLQDESFAKLKDAEPIGRFEPAGSYRRRSETVGDLDVIVESEHPEYVFDHFESWNLCDKVLMRGDTKMTYRIDALQVDIRVVPSESYGACLQYFTGDVDHNTALRTVAKEHGVTLNEYGAFTFHYEDDEIVKDEKIAGETEEGMYGCLGLEMPDPTERTEEWVKERWDQVEV